MNAPRQIFDFAEQLGVSQSLQAKKPETKSAQAPPDLPFFDADDFEKKYLEINPDHFGSEAIREAVRDYGAAHISLLNCLPDPVFRHLLVSWKPREFFAFLGHKHFAELKKTLFRGFQVTPSQLKNPAILNRLTTHFRAHPLDFYAFFLVSRFGTQPTQDNRESSLEQLGSESGRIALAAEIGPFDAMTLSVAVADFEAFHFYLQQMQAPQDFHRQIEAQREAFKAESERKQALTLSPPAPDSSSAHFWHSKAAQLQLQVDEMLPLFERVVSQEKNNKAKQLELENAGREIEKLKINEKQQARIWEKRLANAQKNADARLCEVRAHGERETRKHQKAEREILELQAQLKTMQKQLRRAQQVLEEERKTILALKSQSKGPRVEPETSTPPSREVIATSQTAAQPKTAPEPKTPLDDLFEWRADGRLWKVTPRQVKRMIDCNDEDSLWQIQLALQVLEKSDREKYSRFFFRLKSEDPSYALILTQPTQRVLVDASNVARHQTNKHGRGILRNLLNMRNELRRLGCWPIVLWADASLRHNIDEGKKFAEMLARGEILQTDKGVEADELLAREARKWGASVVTNDTRFFHKVSPDFEPPRITFRIYDGTVVVDDF